MMQDYKTILTHFDTSPYAAPRLRTAAALAELSDAHLIALYSVLLPQYGVPFMADGSALLTQELLRIQTLKDEQAAQTFARTAQGLLRNPEWRTGVGDPAAVISEHGRYADLIVLGQYAPNESNDVPPDFIGRVLMGCGRPVLMLPCAEPPRALAMRPLVAWNGSREAARAVTAALPLLRRAPAVHLVSFDAPDAAETPAHHPPLPTVALATYLARHGIQAVVINPLLDTAPIGPRILHQAQALDADLIIMGGYGHSRAYEFVLGGATRSVLDNARIPILFAH